MNKLMYIFEIIVNFVKRDYCQLFKILEISKIFSIFNLGFFFLLALFLQIPLLIILQSWPCQLDLRQIFLAVYQVMEPESAVVDSV